MASHKKKKTVRNERQIEENKLLLGCANVCLYSSMRLCTAKYVYEVYVHTFVSAQYGMTQACMNEHTCTGLHVWTVVYLTVFRCM